MGKSLKMQCPLNFVYFNGVVIYLCATLLFKFVQSGNINYTLDACGPDDKNSQAIEAAVVSLSEPSYSLTETACYAFFRTKKKRQVFLIQLQEFNVRQEDGQCLDYLTLEEMNEDLSVINKILDKACGTLPDEEVNRKMYTTESFLKFTWVQNKQGRKITEKRSSAYSDTAPVMKKSGFKIILTALTNDQGIPCDPGSEVRCPNNDCISSLLRCDSVPHCLEGQDEYNCGITPKSSGFTFLKSGQMLSEPPRESMMPVAANMDGNLANTSTTPLPLSTTFGSGDGPFGSFELGSIVMMAAIFAVVFIVCLILGWREKRAENWPQEGTTGEEASLTINSNTYAIEELEQNNLRVNVNGATHLAVDGDLEPGLPSTPPPSYSVIERQTSYVSHISQTSDQVSIPPDYDDAVELPGSGARRTSSSSRRPPTARRHSSSLRSRMTHRLFSRSVSQQEPTAAGARGRYRSQASSSSDTTELDINGTRGSSFNDDVFETPASANGSPDHSTPHTSLITVGTNSSTTYTSPDIGDPRGVTLLSDIAELNSHYEGSQNSLAASSHNHNSPRRSSPATLQRQSHQESDDDNYDSVRIDFGDSGAADLEPNTSSQALLSEVTVAEVERDMTGQRTPPNITQL